jgi:TetR/AcrR family transcriptional regulator
MDTRTRLLRAALELFAQRGFDAVGVQQIVEAVGVTKPTLYHFFGSKHGLLQALFTEYATGLDDALRAATDYRGDLPATLERIVTEYAEFAAREPLFYRFELALYFAPPQSEAHQIATKHYAQRHALIAEVFVRAVREHGNLRNRQQRYALSLVGLINSYVALQLNGRAVITDRLRREIVQQFSYGIYS